MHLVELLDGVHEVVIILGDLPHVENHYDLLKCFLDLVNTPLLFLRSEFILHLIDICDSRIGQVNFRWFILDSCGINWYLVTSLRLFTGSDVTVGIGNVSLLILVNILFLFQINLSKETQILEEVVLVSVDGEHLEDADHLVVALVHHLVEEGGVWVLHQAHHSVLSENLMLVLNDWLNILVITL